MRCGKKFSHSLAHCSQRRFDTLATTRVTVGNCPPTRQRGSALEEQGSSCIIIPLLHIDQGRHQRVQHYVRDDTHIGLSGTSAPLWQDPTGVKGTLLVNIEECSHNMLPRIFNRPGVAGAVLQSPPSFIKSVTAPVI